LETEEQFRQTADLLEELRFDAVHVAAYSPRAGTYVAKNLEDNVPPEEKKRRLDEVERLQKGIATEINARLQNKVVEVLVEGKARDRWQSRARNGKLVFFNDNSDRLGQLVKIRIEQTSPWSLRGRVES
jgi:tRNA-2-methylthio-N6-dimethylallyladenosine synthase